MLSLLAIVYRVRSKYPHSHGLFCCEDVSEYTYVAKSHEHIKNYTRLIAEVKITPRFLFINLFSIHSINQPELTLFLSHNLVCICSKAAV